MTSGSLTTTLGALVESGTGFIQTGPGSQLRARDYAEDGIPVVMPQQLGDNEIRTSDIARVGPHDRDRLIRYVMHEGDIVFSRRGDVTRRAYVTRRESGWLCGTGCLLLRLNHPACDNRYLVRFLGLQGAREYLTQNAIGSTMPNLNQGILSSVPVVLPPRDRQERIVDVLSAYDDQIENNRRRIRLLEQAARMLYEEWFVRLRFPGHEGTTVTNGVPDGWETKPLIELSSMTMGQSPKSTHYNEEGLGLPFHQGVTNFGRRFPSHRTWCTVTNRIALPGDILFSVRAPVGRINVTLDRIVIGRGIAAVRSNRDQQNFLFYALKNRFFKDDLIGGGTIFPAVAKKDLHRVELTQPEDEVVSLFTEFVAPIDRQIASLQRAVGKLCLARDAVLPRLMNGEIECP